MADELTSREKRELLNRLREQEERERRAERSTLDEANFVNALPAALSEIKTKFTDPMKSWGDLIKEVRDASMDASNNFGTGLKNYETITQEVTKALPELTKLGFTTSEIGRMQEDVTGKIRSNFILASENLETMGVIEKLRGDGAALAASYRQSARSLKEMTDDVTVATRTASEHAVNTSYILETIEKTMQSVDQYRFERGIEGVTRMAAQTASMGISYDKIKGLADKIMDPEGAVKMVSQLQLLGVTTSGLLDPFKVMYMAQSDMEGLTEEVGKAVAAMGTFNTETGKMEISPHARMEMRQLGETLNLTVEDLNKMVSLQGKMEAMRFDLDGLGISEEDRLLFANLAEFNKDKGGFEVNVMGEQKLVSELSMEDISFLRETPKDAMDAAQQQLHFIETIKNSVESIRMAMQAPLIGTNVQMDSERGYAALFRTSTDAFTKAVRDSSPKAEINRLTGKIEDLLPKLISGDMVGNFNINAIIEGAKGVITEGGASYDQITTDFTNSLKQSMSTFVSDVDSKLRSDSFSSVFINKIAELSNTVVDVMREKYESSHDRETSFEGAAKARETSSEEVDALEGGNKSIITVEDFIIKALPKDTISPMLVGGTNLPDRGLDINETLTTMSSVINNSNTNLIQNTPIGPRVRPEREETVSSQKEKEEPREINVNFGPLTIRMEGEGKSVLMAMDDANVRDKIITLVGKAIAEEYSTKGDRTLSLA